jgi:predicted lipoprotein with Yx(FWY)xxD motif
MLTAGNGRTLYVFDLDKPNVSNLSKAGLSLWPPLHAVNMPRANRGAIASDLGTITGVDGKAQVTYAGHPLYYFSGDTKAGQTRGQGLKAFGAKWYVVAPSGKKITHRQGA